MARSFWDSIDLDYLDYDELLPLVPEGADREARIEEIVEHWSTPSPAGPPPDNDVEFQWWVDKHIEAGGFVLEYYNFIDYNTGEDIDFNEILGRVEQRIRSKDESASKDSLSCPEMLIAIRACRIELCKVSTLPIRPSFVALGVQFGDYADFERVGFGANASFSEAKFGDHASFHLAKFGDHASFHLARFGDNAFFFEAEFGDDANFLTAQFGDNASFSHARFGANACFSKTRFGANTTFRFAQFGRGMRLNDANLSGADLRDVTGLILDDTVIRGARFSPRAKDPWSVLRRTYTGPRMLFTLLVLVLFFTPYAVRTAGWVGVYHSQQRLMGAIDELHERYAERTQPFGDALRADLAAIEALLPTPNSDRWRERWVLSLVIGLDRHWGHVILAVLLILYNVLRGMLTIFVAPMRDEEERSGHSPMYRIKCWRKFCASHNDAESFAKNPTRKERWRARARKPPMFRQWLRSHTDAYGWLMPFHGAASVLFWFALAAFVWNAYLWLTYTVYIPVF